MEVVYVIRGITVFTMTSDDLKVISVVSDLSSGNISSNWVYISCDATINE